MFQVKQEENDDDKAAPPLPQLNILPSDDENDENISAENNIADVSIKDLATDSGWEDIFGENWIYQL